jgi:hypothetical protein
MNESAMPDLSNPGCSRDEGLERWKARSTEEWASLINAQWEKAVWHIILTGQLLRACHRLTEHGQWGQLFNTGVLRFNRQTAFRLMMIARHPVLSDVSHVKHLPPAWGTLYQLSRLHPKAVLHLINTKVINPNMRRVDALKLFADWEGIQTPRLPPPGRGPVCRCPTCGHEHHGQSNDASRPLGVQ